MLRNPFARRPQSPLDGDLGTSGQGDNAGTSLPGVTVAPQGWQGRSSKPPESREYSAEDPLNVDSELLPSEYPGYEVTDSTDSERADVALVRGRFTATSTFRRPVEREWVLSIAQYEGRQWLGWDDAISRAFSLMDEDNEDKYVTHNLIRPLLMKVVAMATQTKPDADVAPESDSDLDRAAASEARAVMSHCSRIHNQTTQTQQVAKWAAICGVGYTKHYWDAAAYCDVAKFGPDGSIIGKQSLPVGEECETIIPPWELYCDPVAKTWETAGWVIHASLQEMSYFIERFGKKGKEVRCDAKDAYGDFGSAYTTGGYGGASQLPTWFAGGMQRKAALMLEMWEKPTPRYPKGRLIIVAGTTRLYRGPWPLQCRLDGKATFPFARLVYEEASGHPYGRGLVPDLAPLQVGLNRLITRMTERVEQDKLTVGSPVGVGVPTDAFDGTDDGRAVRKIPYDPTLGPPPAWMAPPPLSPVNSELITLTWVNMQHIAGIHDVSQGNVPPGVTAGTAIEMLQQGDNSQMAGFTAFMECFVMIRGNLRIAIYAQYAGRLIPRLMGMDDSGNPRTALKRAMAFKALTSGGACGYYVVPGSATPKSPAGEQQEALDFLKGGLFGNPTDPAAAAIAVKFLSLAKSDMILDGLQDQIAHARAMAPSPADLANQQHAQVMAQQAQALQFEGQKLALENQYKIQFEQTMAAIKEQIDAAAQQAKAQRELEQIQTQNQHDQVMAMLDKIVPALSGVMDPTAVVDLEGKIGLTGKVPPPPVPATGTAKKKPAGGAN